MLVGRRLTLVVVGLRSPPPPNEVVDLTGKGGRILRTRAMLQQAFQRIGASNAVPSDLREP